MQGRESTGTGSQYMGDFAAGALAFAAAPPQRVADELGPASRPAQGLLLQADTEAAVA